jgi:hypothetical protein
VGVELGGGIVAQRQVGGQRQGVQLRLVVEREHPHRAVFVRVGTQHGVLCLIDGAASAGAILRRTVNRRLPCQTEGREQRVTACDVQVAGDIVRRERIGGTAHVPVHGPRVAPDTELDGLVAGHLGEGLGLTHVRLRVAVSATVDCGPHRRGAERRCGGVEAAAYALGGAAGVLEVQRLVGERGGPLLDAKLSAVAVIACDDLGEARVQAIDVGHADTAGGCGAGRGCRCGCCRRDATDEGTALHVGVLLLRWGRVGRCPAPWHEP